MISYGNKKEKIDTIYYVDQLIEALCNGTGVKDFRYWVPENDKSVAEAFLNALTVENCPDRIVISGSIKETVDVDAVLEFAIKLLASGKCKKGMVLCLYGTNICDYGVKKLVAAICKYSEIKELTLDVQGNNITSVGAVELADAMRMYPATLANVIIHDNNIGADGVKALASLLQQGICKPDFEFSLGEIDFEGKQDEVIDALLQALLSGNCPTGFVLDLRGVSLKQHTVLRFAETIKSGKLPDGFGLYMGPKLPFNDNKSEIGNDGANAFAEAIMSGHAPTNLSLSFHDSNIQEGMLTFAAAVKHENCPKGLCLFLPNSYYLNCGADRAFAASLMTSTSLVGLYLDGIGDSSESDGCNLLIRHCYLRNKLMHEYPEYAEDIKKMCIEKRLFQSKYKIFDYWTKMQRWVINESEFPSPGLRDKLPEQLLSDLNYLNKLEKEMYLVRYDASRRGFFAGNHASNKVTNFEEYTKHVIGKSV